MVADWIFWGMEVEHWSEDSCFWVGWEEMIRDSWEDEGISKGEKHPPGTTFHDLSSNHLGSPWVVLRKWARNGAIILSLLFPIHFVMLVWCLSGRSVMGSVGGWACGAEGQHSQSAGWAMMRKGQGLLSSSPIQEWWMERATDKCLRRRQQGHLPWSCFYIPWQCRGRPRTIWAILKPPVPQTNKTIKMKQNKIKASLKIEPSQIVTQCLPDCRLPI